MKNEKLYKGLTFKEILKCKESIDINELYHEYVRVERIGIRKQKVFEKQIEENFWKKLKAFEKLLNDEKIIDKLPQPDGSLKLVFKSGAVFICRGVLVNICYEVLGQ